MLELFTWANKMETRDTLIKIRIVFYCFNFIHLTAVAIYLLPTDFTKADDPRVWTYQDLKWKLITTWFNLLNLAYLPLGIYCEWSELHYNGQTKEVKFLNNLRHLIFTSIILPTTMFADILFWQLWNKDRELLACRAVDQVIPFWSQHSMHTVSLIVAAIDLLIIPRQRPKDLKPGFILMTAFIGLYILVISLSIALEGEYVYPVLKLFSTAKLCLLALYVYVEHVFYYMAQWCVVDFIWGHRQQRREKKMVKPNFFQQLLNPIYNFCNISSQTIIKYPPNY